jgi:hypothetical protein
MTFVAIHAHVYRYLKDEWNHDQFYARGEREFMAWDAKEKIHNPSKG